MTLSGGHVTGVTDSASRTLVHTYDGSGDLTDVVDVGGGHSQFTYGGSHGMLTMRSPRATETRRRRRRRSRPITTTAVDGSTGNPTSGRTTTFDCTSEPDSTIVTGSSGQRPRHLSVWAANQRDPGLRQRRRGDLVLLPRPSDLAEDRRHRPGRPATSSPTTTSATRSRPRERSTVRVPRLTTPSPSTNHWR